MSSHTHTHTPIYLRRLCSMRILKIPSESYQSQILKAFVSWYLVLINDKRCSSKDCCVVDFENVVSSYVCLSIFRSFLILHKSSHHSDINLIKWGWRHGFVYLWIHWTIIVLKSFLYSESKNNDKNLKMYDVSSS